MFTECLVSLLLLELLSFFPVWVFVCLFFSLEDMNSLGTMSHYLSLLPLIAGREPDVVPSGPSSIFMFARVYSY